MLDAIQDKMGIDNDADSDLADLEMETKPEICWQKSSASNSVCSAAKSPLHEPKPNAQPFISAYASAHPWEDWAET